MLSYDHFVLACGQRPSVDLVEGMGRFGIPLNSVGDALHLRKRILSRLQQATIEPGERLRRWRLPSSSSAAASAASRSPASCPTFGDCALVPNACDGQLCPPTAQFAERQARLPANNLSSTVRGAATRSFRYRPRGQLASIGHTKAVADVFGLRLSGFAAWLVWRMFYLLRIPTAARKAHLEWTWAMFFPPDIAHMNFDRAGTTSSAVEQRSDATTVDASP